MTTQDNEKEPPDDLTVIMGFTQMLCSGTAEDAKHFARDHGWLDEQGQATVAGTQLARALLQQRKTRTVFRLW